MKVFNLAEELEKERKKNKEQQERINEFKLTIRVQNMQIEELINRIDKAIEYIEKYKTDDYCDGMSAKQLLDILKGE